MELGPASAPLSASVHRFPSCPHLAAPRIKQTELPPPTQAPSPSRPGDTGFFCLLHLQLGVREGSFLQAEPGVQRAPLSTPRRSHLPVDRVACKACKIAWLFRISLSWNPPGPFSPFSRPLSYLGHSRARRTSHSPCTRAPAVLRRGEELPGPRPGP